MKNGSRPVCPGHAGTSRLTAWRATGGLATWMLAVVVLLGATLMTAASADAAAPTVTTSPATEITNVSAELKGLVNANNVETEYHFEYGTTQAYGMSTAAVNIGKTNLEVVAETLVTGLKANTTYHFRVVAKNSSGEESYGNDREFETYEWGIEATPSQTTGTNQLTAVSCTSSTFCFATANNEKLIGTFSYGETWDGSKWTLREMIELGSLKLVGVSCASSTFCMAVGSKEESGKVVNSAYEWNGTKWTAETAPNPSGNSNRLTAVSCTSSTFCFATGYRAGAVSYTYGESWDGSKWTLQEEAAPLGTLPIAGVSCTSSTFCMAVGSHTESNGNVVNLADKWNGTKWTAETTPNETGKSNQLTAVSCTSSTFCFATGYDAERAAGSYGETWNGSEWTLHEAAGEGLKFAGVSCTSTFCTAVGTLIRTGFVDAPAADKWTIASSAWSGSERLQPTGKNDHLVAVSCVSSCTAVGSSSTGETTSNLVERSP
jgi:hypothetical protein